jgi:gas vesicle protein
MFGFGKKKQDQEQPGQPAEKSNKIDKLVMGAILGVAVGSVIGMSLAPKKGKDTRKYLAEKGKEALDKGVSLSQKIISERNPQQKKKGLFSKFKGIFSHKNIERDKSLPPREDLLKKIPHEEVEK